MVDTIKPPCSIGDEVYIRWSRFDGRVYKETVRSLLLTESGLSINTDNLIGGDWLEDIFPTQEAAFESIRRSGYEPFLEEDTMSIFPDVEAIANHIHAIDELVEDLGNNKEFDAFSYDWMQAEIIDLNPVYINYLKEHGGVTSNCYIWKSEYCRSCAYFRTSSPGKYVRVPLFEE